MSNTLFGKNILRGEVRPAGSFVDSLRSTHAVADDTPAARWTQQKIEERFQEAHQSGTTLGYADGYAKGEAKGLEVGLATGVNQVRLETEAAHQEAIAQFSQDLSATLIQTQQSIANWYAESEQKLAIIAVEIAQRAIGQELSLNEEAIIQIARQVLSEVTTGNSIRLRVNPIQTAILESRREEILQSISHIRNIEIVADPNIQTGLIVESESGVVDGRIETYLQRITDQILGEAA